MSNLEDPTAVRKQLEKVRKDESAPDDDVPRITILHIDVPGSRGRHYKGDFSYQVPSIGDTIEVGQLKARYLPNGAVADVRAAVLVEAVSYLAVTLQPPVPEWWRPMDFMDEGPILALYKEARDYERRFLGEAVGEEDAAASRGAEDAGGDGAEAQAAPVEDLQPPAKRREVLASHGSGGG